MGELFRKYHPKTALPWTGERLVSNINGAIEGEHLHRYFLARDLCRGKRVVDVASGEGYGAALLAQTASDVIAIEIDEQSVMHASCAYKACNLHYIQGNACQLPLKNASVDVVVSFETLEHLEDHKSFLNEVSRILVPNGLLIISTPDSDIYSAADSIPNPFHVKELSKTEFDSTLHSVFQNLVTLQQRVLTGSVMLPDILNTDKMLIFEQRSAEMFASYRYLPQAPYLIALASNAAVPSVGATIYIQNVSFDANNSDLQAELERLQQVEVNAREQALVMQRTLNETAAAQTESARLNSALSSLQAELERLQQVEVNAREQASEKENLKQINLALRKELEEVRTNVESTGKQLDQSHLLVKRQTFVIQQIQNELTLQSQNSQSCQKEISLMRTEKGELMDEIAALQAKALRYSQTLDDVSRLVVPVPIRKLFPGFMRRPVQAFKQKLRA